jgi:hypothetical protein
MHTKSAGKKQPKAHRNEGCVAPSTLQKGSSRSHFSKRRERRSPGFASRERRTSPWSVQARTWARCMQGQPDSLSMTPQLVAHDHQLVPYPGRMGAAKFFGMCPATVGVSTVFSSASMAPCPQPTFSQLPWLHTIQAELSQDRSFPNSHQATHTWQLHTDEPRSGICGVPPSPFPLNNLKAPCCGTPPPLRDCPGIDHASASLDTCMYSAACDSCMHSEACGGLQLPERIPGIPCLLEAAADSHPCGLSSHSGRSSTEANPVHAWAGATEVQAVPQDTASMGANLEVATFEAHCATHSHASKEGSNFSAACSRQLAALPDISQSHAATATASCAEHHVALEGRVPVVDRVTCTSARTARLGVDAGSDEGLQGEAEPLWEARAAVIAARKAKSLRSAAGQMSSGSPPRVALTRDHPFAPSASVPSLETSRNRSTSPLGAI